MSVADTTIADATPYLDVRHYLVHADGKLADSFIAKNPHIPKNQNNFVKQDEKYIKETKMLNLAKNMITICT